MESAGTGEVGDHNIAGAWINSVYNDEGRSARVVYSLNADGAYTYLAVDRADGSTLEVQSGVRKINPKGARYSIYYRP